MALGLEDKVSSWLEMVASYLAAEARHCLTCDGRMTSARSAGYAVFTCKFRKEGGKWLACCEELGTATFGRSIQEAQRKLDEAVLLHLNTLEDVGERERFFREHNIDLCGRFSATSRRASADPDY